MGPKWDAAILFIVLACLGKEFSFTIEDHEPKVSQACSQSCGVPKILLDIDVSE